MLIFDKDGHRFKVEQDHDINAYVVDVAVLDESENTRTWFTLGVVASLQDAWEAIADYLDIEPE